MKIRQYTLITGYFAECLGSVLTADSHTSSASGHSDVDGPKKRLTVLNEHQGPVIGPEHPDVKASKNQSDFETGHLIKHEDVYHMLVNEMFGRAHRQLRCSNTNLRSKVWLAGVEYNKDEGFWNVFYAANYRGGNGKKGENINGNYQGRIWCARSKAKGPDGIAGSDFSFEAGRNTPAMISESNSRDQYFEFVCARK